jgi:hypothetical protein
MGHQVPEYSHRLGDLGLVGCSRIRGKKGLVADITRKLDQVVGGEIIRFEYEMGRWS